MFNHSTFQRRCYRAKTSAGADKRKRGKGSCARGDISRSFSTIVKTHPPAYSIPLPSLASTIPACRTGWQACGLARLDAASASTPDSTITIRFVHPSPSRCPVIWPSIILLPTMYAVDDQSRLLSRAKCWNFEPGECLATTLGDNQ